MDQGAHNATLCPENPFWHYSLTQYAKPECAEFLLKAQNDDQLDINLLLYIGWLATLNKTLHWPAIEESLCLQWTAQVILPLRTARLNSKALSTLEAPHNDKLYQQLKQTELQAEQRMQALLFNELNNMNTGPDDFNQCLIDSLHSYGNALGSEQRNRDSPWIKQLSLHLAPA